MTYSSLFRLSPVLVAGLLTLFAINLPVRADDGAENSLSARVEALENRIAELEETVAAQQVVIEQHDLKLTPVQVSFDDINGLAGPHLIITGVNVHIRSGEGATDAAVNGLGNLIVGYNELPPVAASRDGSHNLIVGRAHGYGSFGGLVAGVRNSVTAPYASVSGGSQNLADGFGSNISGGFFNEASGLLSSVSGGLQNVASADRASVSGGRLNTASGNNASVSGGFQRTASGLNDWAAGSLFEDE